MQRITDIFAHQKLTFSFELFPPKTEEGYIKLLNTIHQLSALKPDFISCTYGAGGGNREKTLEIVELIQNHHHVPSVAHLTCVLHSKDEIKNILTGMKKRGICNLLALRGDPRKTIRIGHRERIILNIAGNWLLLSVRTSKTISLSAWLAFPKGICSVLTATLMPNI